MDRVFEYECECGSCEGTGLYVGMAERSGAAVVCQACKGSGRRHMKIEYKDFEGRKVREDVVRVYRTNPGIIIGEGGGIRLEDFGGIYYEDWLKGGHLGPGTEDRKHSCPAWFYQTADYKLKPDWTECALSGAFSECKHFCEKEKCWARWDREND